MNRRSSTSPPSATSPACGRLWFRPGRWLAICLLLAAAGTGWSLANYDVMLSASGATLPEDGSTTVDIIATLSAAQASATTINLSFSGTATAGTDYSKSNSIVVATGATTGSMTITGLPDTLYEGDETITVSISSVSPNTSGNKTSSTSVTLNDDDSPPTVAFNATTSSGNETSGVVNIPVSLNTATGLDATVDYDVIGGTATGSGTDFTLASGTLTFTAGGSLTQSIGLTVVGDSIDEANETVIIQLSAPSNATLGGNTTHTFTILDNDGPTVTLSLSGSPFTEGAGSATVTATLSAFSPQDVTVDLAFSGTASTTPGVDYNASNTQIVITAGQLSGGITLSAVTDNLHEGNETVVVDISGVTNGTESGSQSVTATIADIDPPPTVTLSLSSPTLAENGGTTNVIATLSALSGLPVTVNLGFSGTATGGGVDYTKSGSSVTIGAGVLSNSIILTGKPDSLNEGDETIIVDITSVTNGTESGVQQVTVTILDADGPPTVNLALSGSPMAENGGVATVTANLSGFSGLPVTVNLAFSGTAIGGGVDYTCFGNQIVIPAGQTSGSVTLTAVNDLLVETTETVVVDITTVVNATTGGVHQVTAQITDDDSQVPTLSVANASVTEGNSGTTTMTFTITRGGNTQVPLAVNYATSDLTATAGSDYVAASGTAIFAPGATTAVVGVTVNGDVLNEGDETFQLALSLIPVVAGSQVSYGFATGFPAGGAPVNATVGDLNTDGRPDLVMATASGVAVLLDTTPPGAPLPTFAAHVDLSVVSGAPVTVAVGDLNGDGRPDIVSANGDATVSIFPNTTTSGATTPTFAARVDLSGFVQAHGVAIGDLNGDGKPDLVIADAASGNLTVMLNTTAQGSNALTFAGAQIFAAGSGSVMVALGDLNGDGRLDIVSIDPTSGKAWILLNQTAAGTTTLVMAAAVGLATGSNPQAVAIADIDGDGKPDLAVANSGSTTVSILINQTTAGAAVFAPKSDVDCGLGINPAWVMAADLDADGKPDLALALAGSQVGVLVNTTTAAGAPLFAALQTFPTTAHPASILVADFNGDGRPDLALASPAAVPNGAAVLLNQSSLTSAGATIGTGIAIGTIADDDPQPTLSLSVGAASMPEFGGGVVITATLSAVSGRNITADIAFAGTATRDVDYSPSATSIAIPAGSLSTAFTVSSIDDSIDEPDETIILSLINVANATAAGGAQQVTIIDDDISGLVVTISSVSTDATYKNHLVVIEGPQILLTALTIGTQIQFPLDADLTLIKPEMSLTFDSVGPNTHAARQIVSVNNTPADKSVIVDAPLNDTAVSELVTIGRDATIKVHLTSQPTAPVHITFTSGNPGRGKVTPTTLDFAVTSGGANGWDVEKKAIFSGIDNLVLDNDALFNITGAVTSGDPAYAGNLQPVPAIVIDDEAVQNQPPVITVNNPLTVAVGGTGFITPAMMDCADDGRPTSSTLTFHVLIVPSDGNLYNTGALVTPDLNNVFTPADIAAGNIKYVHDGLTSRPDSFVFQASDGALSSTQTAFVIDVIADSPPAVDLVDTGRIFTDGTDQPALAPNATVTDSDADVNTNYNGGRLTVDFASGGSPGDELLVVAGGLISLNLNQVSHNGTVIGTWSGGSGGVALEVDFNPAAVPADMPALLASLHYRNLAPDRIAGTRSLRIKLDDGHQPSDVATRILPVFRPVTLVLPLTIATFAGLPFPGAVIIDAMDDAGLDYELGAGPSKGAVTIADPALGDFIYTPAAGATGTDTFTIRLKVKDPSSGIYTGQTVEVPVAMTITGSGDAHPLFTSNPPMEVEVGQALVYSPTVSTAGLASPVLRFVLLDIATDATLSFSTSTGTVNWSSVPASTTGYYRFGILVIDDTSQSSSFQQVLLKVVNPVGGDG